ncbi:hypothetical protein MMC07_008181 [Pseudocyphellaria aurata]|nr:hypothetical protein [Pseudocyphellaria aurata]
MVFNTITVSAAVGPSVIETYFSHYLNRKPLRQKPTAHVSYHGGLNLIRRFLHHASLHTIEELQAFTAPWIPSPRWIKIDEVEIPEDSISQAANAIISQLGHRGIDRVGGSRWWQWRLEGTVLKADWIEMRAHYDKRIKMGDSGKRVMLYVHGGAYYFGSVDEHRYQMQRHARKLEARVFARVAGDGSLDYIPAHGFLHRPSRAWPPPNSDDVLKAAVNAVKKVAEDSLPRTSRQQLRRQTIEDAVRGFSVDQSPDNSHSISNPDDLAPGAGSRAVNTLPGAGQNLSIMLDGNLVEIKDQIQIYATNQLISHPLVSPVLTPILGGLPPLMILTGGGELLRDEQIYLAHKAAQPREYAPDEAYLKENPEARKFLAECRPTNVQLQVWDDLCHVAPTLSFTRPAKYMYRSIAQFGAWALAQAQETEIHVQDPDDVSVISSNSDTENERADKPESDLTAPAGTTVDTLEKVGRAGERLPPFRNHMIRQRVDRHGNIYPLAPSSSFPALQMDPSEIGVIKPGPVRKWTDAKQVWDAKFAKEKRKIQNQRAMEMTDGYQTYEGGEVPPPSALAGKLALGVPKERKRKRGWGISMWSGWGSSHDEKTVGLPLRWSGHETNETQLAREEKASKEGETAPPAGQDGAGSPDSDIPNLRKNIPPSEYVRHGKPSDFKKKPYVKGEPLQGILKKPRGEPAVPGSSADAGKSATDDEITPSPEPVVPGSSAHARKSATNDEITPSAEPVVPGSSAHAGKSAADDEITPIPME